MPAPLYITTAIALLLALGVGMAALASWRTGLRGGMIRDAAVLTVDDYPLDQIPDDLAERDRPFPKRPRHRGEGTGAARGGAVTHTGREQPGNLGE